MIKYLLTAVFSFCLFLTVHKFLLIGLVISQSMAPTLEIGDRVLVIRWWPRCWIRKGQIIIFSPIKIDQISHFEPYFTVPLIKRIVGLPGEKVSNNSILFSANDGKVDYPELDLPPGWYCVCGNSCLPGNKAPSFMTIPYRNILGIVISKLPSTERI